MDTKDRVVLRYLSARVASRYQVLPGSSAPFRTPESLETAAKRIAKRVSVNRDERDD